MIFENCSTLEITCILQAFVRYAINNMQLYDYEDCFHNQSNLNQWKYSMHFAELIAISGRGQAKGELVFKKKEPGMGYRQEICYSV